MKSVIGVLIIVTSFPAFAQMAQYPRIQDVLGKIKCETPVEGKGCVKGEVFRQRVHFQLPADTEVLVDVSPTTQMFIQGPSEVIFPVIEFDHGLVDRIQIRFGGIRIRCQADCSRRIETPLSDDELKTGDFYFRYDPKEPSVRWVVLEGKLSVRGLENDQFFELKTGQETEFVGINESDEVKYDELMNGRKIAKGAIKPIRTTSSEDVKNLKKVWQVIDQKRKVILAKIPKRAKDQICDQPWGRLNECAWTCQGKSSKNTCLGSCVRTRCNANGKWADSQVVTGLENRCSNKVLVDRCNY